ncbi:MAG TPA: hypothetical protein VHS33_04435 [Sphingomicrobium sp.]|nr:hypothetical protein [Sphingomicrobium sp.]
MASSTATIDSNSRRSSKSGHKLLARAGILSGALAAAAVFLPSSLASWVDVDHPEVAARIAPWDAFAAADAAAARSRHPQNTRVRELVRTVLARDATQVQAIELRALDLLLSGKSQEARRLFQLSDRLSRRSLPTRLWLIQDAVDQGNVVGALRNFDIALRTTTDAQPILFPVLAKASADPTLTKPLAETLDQPSDWRLMFFEWALANDRDVVPLANVVAHMGDRRFVLANGVDQRLIERLVTDGGFSSARLLNRRFGPTSSGVADPNFGSASARYPFGWGFVNDGSLSAERASAGGAPVLSYSAAPAKSGQVAAQLLALQPGRHVLATSTAGSASGAAPYWSITCAATDGKVIARLDQPMTANGRAAAIFAVPVDCDAQWLTLTLRSTPDSSPQSGTIAFVSVAPR